MFHPIENRCSIALRRHLAFRDYLLKHPDEVQRYGRLKQELAEKFRNDRSAYTNTKDEYIQMITNRAMYDLEAI